MPDLVTQRLDRQGLILAAFRQPSEVVGWLGAVQSQDYAGALWALALRMGGGVSESALESAFADGEFLRTHILRPTWHFVLPADIRWMLTLTAPRVHALSAYYYRQSGLDDAIFARSNDLIAKALQGGVQLTRAELADMLQGQGIATDELRLTHLMAHAELDGVICSGARRGKQHTYALLDERAPNAKLLTRDESLAELARRYFTSHGPATLEDYAWWSGLTVTDARAGLESIKSSLISEAVDGKTYWRADSTPLPQSSAPVAYLLPNYDEFTVAYTDRSAIYDSQHDDKLDSRGNVLFNNVIMIDGRIAGIWKRTFRKKSVTVELTPFRLFSATESAAVAAAAQRYADFVGLPLILAESKSPA